MKAKLMAARTLLAGGWSEPYCRTVDGTPCRADDEGAAVFTLEAALQLNGCLEAWAVLEEQIAPCLAQLDALTLECGLDPNAEQLERYHALAAGAGSEQYLSAWIRNEGRTVRDVLLLLDRAIGRTP